ncbi:MAG: translation elongation factor Ts [Phycisphaerae bacterium]|nr:translation elongation factor Ts [Phycisphaerae bacterium]
MAEITAEMVRQLRERSGLPMMDCKKALAQTHGDAEAAYELLRKSGAAAAEKKAGRETGEGRVGVFIDKAKGVAALAVMRCETAPVANNPDFKELAAKVAKHVALTGCTDVDALLTQKHVDGGPTIQDMLHDLLNRIRENMKVARVVRHTGRVAAYVHHDGKLGVLLVVEGEGGDDALLNDVCMHIAAMSPMATNRQEIPKDVVAKEEEIAREQVRASGKPENMLDKILVGKMNRWFGDHVLTEQAFVKDDKKTVGQVLKAAGLTAKTFARISVGGA